MSTETVAKDLIGLWSELKFLDSGETYWSPDVVSVEAGGPPDMDRTSRGIDAVRGKGEWWANAHETHSMVVEGPWINDDQFTVRFKMDLTVKASGQRMQMDEIGLYTIKNDKIVEERFFYGG